MTRDIAWGVPVPLDDPDAKGKVLFVWFDAPIGYVSFTARLCEQRDGDWRGTTRNGGPIPIRQSSTSSAKTTPSFTL